MASACALLAPSFDCQSFKACPACRETLEFRDMAVGVRGRNAHRAQEVPKYEYEKYRAPIKVEE